MSEIDRIIIVTAEVEPRRTPPVHINHWCEHAGCKQWGAFGYSTRFGTLWTCGDHRADGEKLLRR